MQDQLDTSKKEDTITPLAIPLPSKNPKPPGPITLFMELVDCVNKQKANAE